VTVPDRLVYRPVAGRVLLVACGGVAGWWTIDLAVHGGPGEAAVFGLWTVAALSLLSCLFWRPAVIVDDEAVELRNVARDVRVPWAALDAVETRYTLTLRAGGRRYESWAGPAPGRPSLGGALGSRLLHGQRSAGGGADGHRLPDPRWRPGDVPVPTSSRDLRADSGAAAFIVEQRWRAWRDRHPTRPGTATVGEGSGVEGPCGARPVKVCWRLASPGVAAVAAALAACLQLYTG
jgi:hypothetical protein